MSADLEGIAVQDVYPEDVAHCYGCGRLNEDGLQLKTRWDGQETVSVFTPRPEHTAIPGYVYGGLVASLLDCHGTGSAALAGYRAQDWEPGTEPPLRYVTANLTVDFLAPTPLGVPLEVRGTIAEVTAKKVVVEESLTADGVTVARGRVVAVRMPETMSRG
ncbi:PaaI family thioesterase [Mobilicoccus sp.]|uniref:PaaI family thioesterase n=1 Tax=Mobilicoccus sp. TaxID=2034349 RepID=UPI00289A42B6|nr:PaaI family thioesterase [Mobilicoccus sp.]